MPVVKINMMSGKRDFGKDWIHIDSQKFDHIKGSDIYLKNFESEIDLIYCSHGIAYFDRDEVLGLLMAWKRVLKPGGVLRIATPDWAVLRRMAVPLLGPLYGKMNEPSIYHKTVYDYKSLKKVLEVCGFKNIGWYNHKRTEHAQFDDHSAAYFKGVLISLNVECNA